ncbi:carbapenem self-resistance protein CarG family protein [Vreelandella sp. EE22]
MIKRLLFLLAALFSTPALAFSQIELSEGVNRIDLNQNGRLDYVIASVYDRNMSYSNHTLTFFIRLPNDELGIMPAADRDTFTWLDHRIFSGAITVRDHRLFESGGEVFLVVAKKHTENADLFGPGPFSFEIYGVRQFSQHPGTPLHQWSLLKTFESAKHHDSSEQAFQEIDADALEHGSD